MKTFYRSRYACFSVEYAYQFLPQSSEFSLKARGTLHENHRICDGKIGGKRFRCGHIDNGTTSIAIRKLKAASDRRRPPRLLWVPPINPRQEITELRRRDRHHAFVRARPDEAATLQVLCE